CRGIISGYRNHDGTFNFRPFNNTTRAQFAKMLALGRGWTVINPATASFRDVPIGSPFYTFVETDYQHQVITGYGCGAPGEPCPGRYFRPAANATRAQLSKMLWVALTHP